MTNTVFTIFCKNRFGNKSIRQVIINEPNHTEKIYPIATSILSSSKSDHAVVKLLIINKIMINIKCSSKILCK